MSEKPKVIQEECTGCGICVDSCPVQAIEMIDGKAKIDDDKCIDCRACIDACPVQAIK